MVNDANTREQQPRCGARGGGGRLSVDEAARRLGVEPAAVRVFVRLGVLRTSSRRPAALWACDVERLRRELQQRG